MMPLQQKNISAIEEALGMLRDKPVKSTMLERIKVIEKANELVKDMPQPLQLGHGLYYIMDHVSVPIAKHDILLGRIPEEIPNQKDEQWMEAIQQKYGRLGRPDWLSDFGHITFKWEMILEYGIAGLVEKTEKELDTRRNRNEPERVQFLTGILLVYKAFQNYIRRYAKQAKKDGMPEISLACDAIANKPPKTFHEAMQLILFIGHAFSVYAAVNSTLTYGRLDDLLLPYYLRDIESGILTKEMASYIIDDFNCKNNLILGRGEHQMSGGSEKDTGWFRNPTYDTPQYVVIGGYSNSNDHVNNPLTEIFVDRIHPRFENPVYMFRYTKDVKDSTWEALCDKLRQNSSIMVYNDETQIKAMMRSGIAKEDAVNYTMHGCNWPDIPGESLIFCSLNAQMIDRVMKALQCKAAMPKGECTTIDEIYQEIAASFREDVKKEFGQYRCHFATAPEILPIKLTCSDCFMSGTVENANIPLNGSIRYPIAQILLRNIGTAADSMAAIDRIVFKEGNASLMDFVNAMQADFSGYGELHARCLNADKFGCDNELADMHAVRLMDTFLTIVEEESVENGIRNVYTFHATTTDMGHITEGIRTSATPDGRRNHAPLSENLSPTAGVANNGVTALLQSVAKLPFTRIHAGALNLRARNDWVSGVSGLQRLKAVASTYFQLGGMQLQLNVADTAELRDAQAHPENHKDLMVRITGYSAVFIDMCKNAQDEIIRRDELGA